MRWSSNIRSSSGIVSPPAPAQSARGRWSYFALFGMQTIAANVLFWTGHAILFLARMVYVLPTAIFGFVFVAQRPEFDIPVFRCLVLLLGLFALFCYVRELERLGRVFTD